MEIRGMPHSQDEKQIQALGQRILIACANKLGGVELLARYLGASQEQIRDWVTGESVPPVAIVLKAVDPLLGDPEAIWADGPPPGSAEARKLQ